MCFRERERGERERERKKGEREVLEAKKWLGGGNKKNLGLVPSQLGIFPPQIHPAPPSPTSLTLHRSLGSVVTSTSLHRPLPVTAALASGGGASAMRQLRETILAVTALSSTPVFPRISRRRSSPRSEMCVGGKGGTERAVGVDPRGVEEAEEAEALLTSPRGAARAAAEAASTSVALLAESPFSVAGGLHEVASGLSGVGGPERSSEAFICER